MAKTDADAGLRLQLAALDLFRERGYDGATAAEIAARAGVTERTFFRYFSDKREVLFGGEAVLRAALLAAIAQAPARLGAVDTLFLAFRSVIPLLSANRSFSVPRQQVIASAAALQEREHAKLAALADALAEALVARGSSRRSATLAARTAMNAFALVTVEWLERPTPGLRQRLDRAAAELRSLYGPTQGPDVSLPAA